MVINVNQRATFNLFNFVPVDEDWYKSEVKIGYPSHIVIFSEIKYDEKLKVHYRMIDFIDGVYTKVRYRYTMTKAVFQRKRLDFKHLSIDQAKMLPSLNYITYG